MHLHTTTVPTPVGPFTLLVDGGAVCAAGFTARPEACSGGSTRAAGRPASGRPPTPTAWPAGCSPTWPARSGPWTSVEVDQPGRPGPAGGLASLRSVPAGQTISYRQLGALAGLADAATDPLGAQAAGAACAGNNVAVIVPCHRVVRADGRLGGYGGACTASPGSSTTRPPP